MQSNNNTARSRGNRYFSGDDNEFVKRVQGEVDSTLLVKAFNAAMKRYYWAESVVGLDTPLSTHFVEGGLGQEPLQETYALIAAWFRYRKAEELQALLPNLHPYKDEEKRIAMLWSTFFVEEIERLMDIHGRFLRWLLEAAVYARSFPSFEAEKHLKALLEDEYGEMLHESDLMR